MNGFYFTRNCKVTIRSSNVVIYYIACGTDTLSVFLCRKSIMLSGQSFMQGRTAGAGYRNSFAAIKFIND